jgi:hypothetical protein
MTLKKENYYHIGSINKKDVETKLVIGSRTGKFVPNINASKWDDECWLNINFPQVVTNEKAKIDKDVISQTIGDFTHKYYLKPDESLEYEIILDKKPPINSFGLKIDFPDGLMFCYQPPLTPEEIAMGFSRPDNVVGSYAVYWKQKDNQYKTGKFCHIYRPQLTDADGKQIWADISIDPTAKTLTITADNNWLETAKYPVTIDPNIGYSTKGGSAMSTYGYCLASYYNLTDANGGTTSKIHVYAFTSSGTHNVKLTMYDVTSDEIPTNRLATPVVVPIGTDDIEYMGDFVVTLSANTRYFTASSVDSSGAVSVHYDTLGDDNGRYAYQSINYDCSDPWGGNYHQGSHAVSVWADYSAVTPPTNYPRSIAGALPGGVGAVKRTRTAKRKITGFM